jgi:preprotein translocase subunit SecB
MRPPRTCAKAEAFGVIFATTRTQVDKVLRTVTFENLQISKVDFAAVEVEAAQGAERTDRVSSFCGCAERVV